MGVVLEIPAALSRYSDGKSSICVESGNVASILENLWQTFPQLRKRVLNEAGELFPYLLLLHNSQKLPSKNVMEIAITDGDTLEIVALAEGG